MASEQDKDSPKAGVKARIKLLRERFKIGLDADRDNRQKMSEDMKFIYEPDAQWDEWTKRERGKDRPMYTFNRARVTVARVVNDMRSNRPQGKVRAAEDGDKDTSEVIEGLCRNIANNSDFESITDDSAMYQVAGGYSAWRIVTEYSHNTAFDQDITIQKLRNPLCLIRDPDAIDITGKDSKWWIYTDKMSQESYKARWPKAKESSFEDIEFDDDDEWLDDKKVRVAEHWWQEEVKKTIHLLSDGKTIDDSEREEALGRGLTIVKTRENVKCQQVMTAIYSGTTELEPPTVWAGEFFPWVTVFGEYVIIDGKPYWCGLTRHIKDSQRAFNLANTSIVENVAKSSLSQVWATAKQAEGLSAHWADSARKNLFAQIYNNDPQAPGPPQRIGGPDVPVALVQMSGIMGDEIKADSGIFDSSLGNQSNETSGRAIAARQRQGEIATFNFPDNMAKAVRRTWEILIDLIPRIYDTPRSMRILGADLSEKYVKVNEPDANGDTLNDLSRGKYDVTVTVGPSFTSQRQEAVEAYTQIAQGNPEFVGVAGDLMFKAMDLPYAEQIAERMKAMLPPQIQQTLNEDGKNLPPEVRQAMAQADQAMQQVQQHGQLVEKASIEAQQEVTKADKAKAEVQIAIANLKTEEANFKVMKAQFEAEVAKAEKSLADMATGIGMDGIKNEMAASDNQRAQQDAEGHMNAAKTALKSVEEALGKVKADTDEFLTQAADVVASKTSELKAPPKLVSMSTKRVNGQLVGTAKYDDGTERQASVSRQNGELVGSVN